MVQANAKAMLPILVFVALYLGLGITIEYGMGIEMGFYKVPVVGIFLVALLVACIQNRSVKFQDKIKIMAEGVGNPNIILMILIFLCAGAFVGIVGRESAESVAYLFLEFFPAEYSVVVIFIVAALVSLAMGTSVGTITLITPIAIVVAQASGFSVPLCVGSVVGGAMFGDNLSFISDTTIAACQGQGIKMKEKFIANSTVVIPAALVTIVILAVMSIPAYSGGAVVGDYELVKIIPYILVLLGAVAGLNVFIALGIGMLSGAIIMMGTGSLEFLDVLAGIKGGIEGMFETSMVAILVSAIVALVIAYGGFEAVLSWIKKNFKGKSGGMLGIGLLVSAMDISTANNTVAIVMANPLAKDISESYGITPQRTASILDTFSCIMQGIIPYGAQMLVALSALSAAGFMYSAFELIPYLVYPYMMLISSLLFIFLIYGRLDKKKAESA